MKRYIFIARETFGADRTLGRLFTDDGSVELYTLEPHAIDWTKEKKVWGKTAIPCGDYKVLMAYSPKYRKTMPYLLDVPHFSGIMFHPGNTPRDTRGCILVGQHQSVGSVLMSQAGFQLLFHWIEQRFKCGDDVLVHIAERE